MKRTPLKRNTPLARSTFRRTDEQRAPWTPPDTSHLDALSELTKRIHAENAARPKTLATRKRTKYARRERHVDYMLAVKAMLPCILSHLGECEGVVEADHAGDRGLGQKSHDNTVIPLCTRHHRDRTDLTGFFSSFDRATMREWRHARVAETQVSMAALGVEVPRA